MKKILFVMIFCVICISQKIIYRSNYKYISTNILDQNYDWVEVIESKNDVFVGRMSGYGPDCYGCSGYLAYNGIFVGDGNIYYDDDFYGTVRIVAGDRSIPFGSIIKVNDSFMAIVFDRGGAIGFGKKFLFDLLYPNEKIANENGILDNVEFEVLRYGFSSDV